MEVRRWKVIDIYYKRGEEKKAKKLAESYPGYTCEECEGYDEWEGSLQLISTVTITEK